MNAFHALFGGQAWRVTPAGVETRRPDGSAFLHRSKGEPRTMRLYWAYWQTWILAAAQETGVPVAVLLMTIGCENGMAMVDENRIQVLPPRREPKYKSDEATPHQISVGPCHILISTARSVMGTQAINRAWLLDVGNNIRAAARYIASQKAKTGYDPIKVAAAYNAGGLYDATAGAYANPWHLRVTGNHLDRAAAWYGDACAVISEAHLLAQADQAGLGRAA